MSGFWWHWLDWVNHRLPKRRWRRLGNWVCDQASRRG